MTGHFFFWFLTAAAVAMVVNGRCVFKPICWKGWYKFRNHCYLFSTDDQTWHQAKRTCKSNGGALAYITCEAENRFLLSMVKARSWIGGNDIYSEGKWRWTSINKPFTFTKWDPNHNEPNGGRDENCAELYPNNYKNAGHWNDNRCSNKLGYICKRQLRKSKPRRKWRKKHSWWSVGK